MMPTDEAISPWTPDLLAVRLAERIVGLEFSRSLDPSAGRIILNLRLLEDVPEFLFWCLQFELRTTDVRISFDVEAVRYLPGARPMVELDLEPMAELAVDTSKSEASSARDGHRQAFTMLVREAETYGRFSGRSDYDWRAEIHEIEFRHVDHPESPVLYGHSGFAPAQVQTLSESALGIAATRESDEESWLRAEKAAQELLAAQADIAFAEHEEDGLVSPPEAPSGTVSEPFSLFIEFLSTLDDDFVLGHYDASAPVQEFSLDDGNVTLPDGNVLLPDGIVELHRVRRPSDSGPAVIHDTPARHVDSGWN